MDQRFPSSRRRFLGQAATAAAGLGLHGLSLAQGDTWPTRPVKIVCNFPPGSSPDASVR